MIVDLKIYGRTRQMGFYMAQWIQTRNRKDLLRYPEFFGPLHSPKIFSGSITDRKTLANEEAQGYGFRASLIGNVYSVQSVKRHNCPNIGAISMSIRRM